MYTRITAGASVTPKKGVEIEEKQHNALNISRYSLWGPERLNVDA
jgi:hypothetical protein